MSDKTKKNLSPQSYIVISWCMIAGFLYLTFRLFQSLYITVQSIDGLMHSSNNLIILNIGGFTILLYILILFYLYKWYKYGVSIFSQGDLKSNQK